jgi:membrane protease subunit HflK
MSRPRPARLAALGAALLAAAWLASGLYSVESDESAVAFLFGRALARDVLPGIHWNPPAPLGRVVVQRTATSFVMPIGFRLAPARGLAPISDLWLTGDTNLVTARLTVQYRIRSLAGYLLAQEQPSELLRRAGEREVTRFFVHAGVDDVLTGKRTELVRAVARGLQALLDAEGAGIEVQSVTVEELVPPQAGQVRAAFQAVQDAQADHERSLLEAGAYRAQVLAEAEGEAQRLRVVARAERDADIEVARGEAERFRALEREHERAPRLTESRLRLEMLERVVPRLETWVVEPGPQGRVNLRVVR